MQALQYEDKWCGSQERRIPALKPQVAEREFPVELDGIPEGSRNPGKN